MPAMLYQTRVLPPWANGPCATACQSNASSWRSPWQWAVNGASHTLTEVVRCNCYKHLAKPHLEPRRWQTSSLQRRSQQSA